MQDQFFELSDDEDPEQINDILQTIAKQELAEKHGSQFNKQMETHMEAVQNQSTRQRVAKKNIQEFSKQNFNLPTALKQLRKADESIKIVIEESKIG